MQSPSTAIAMQGETNLPMPMPIGMNDQTKSQWQNKIQFGRYMKEIEWRKFHFLLRFPKSLPVRLQLIVNSATILSSSIPTCTFSLIKHSNLTRPLYKTFLHSIAVRKVRRRKKLELLTPACKLHLSSSFSPIFSECDKVPTFPLPMKHKNVLIRKGSRKWKRN